MSKALTLTILFAFASCTASNNAYRIHDPATPGSIVTHEMLPDGLHKVWFIESDDMGFLQKDDQLVNVLTEIHRATRQPGGALVVTYVHGWNHNAAEGNLNLESFKAILQRIIEQENSAALECGSGRAPRPVVGIYIAWRGLLWDGVAKKAFALSYFNRSNAASRFASPTGSEVLAAIARMSRYGNSRSVVIGHSMGGLITESGLIPPMQEALERHAVEKDAAGIPATSISREQFPADLVILINPASRAVTAAQFDSMLQRWSVEVTAGRSPYEATFNESAVKDQPRPWRPLIVSLTSETDKYTGAVFTIGNTITALGKRFKWKEKRDDLPFGEQWDLFTHTAGHWPSLHTHGLEHERGETDDGLDMISRCAPQAVPNTAACVRVGSDQFRFVEKTTLLKSPYWILQIPRTAVDGHDFFKDGTKNFNVHFYRLMKALLAMTGGFHDACYSPIWGERVPQETIESHVPRACDPPPDAKLLQVVSACVPGTECRSTDRWNFRIEYKDGPPYEPQPCDTISWEFAETPTYLGEGAAQDYVPADAMVPGRSSKSMGTAVIMNHLGRARVDIPWDRTSSVIPMSIAFAGERCRMNEGEPCRVGERVRFGATLPPGAPREGTFLWTVNGTPLSEHRAEIIHLFDRAGPAVIAVRFDSSNLVGTGSLPLQIACGDLPARIGIEADQHGGKCSLGDRDCVPVGSRTFRTDLASVDAPGCYTFAWTFDGRPASPGETLTVPMTPGTHEIQATVSTADGRSSSGRKEFSACAPPKPAAITWQGAEGCTPERARLGAPCRPGEAVTVSLRDAAGCETIDWMIDEGTEQRLATIEVTKNEPGVLLVRAHVERPGGRNTAFALISFSEGPPDPSEPEDCASLGPVSIAVKSIQNGGLRPKVPIEYSLDARQYEGTRCDTVTWIFDDGTSAAGLTTTKTFETGGNYRVHVVVSRGNEVQTATATHRVWCPVHGKVCRKPRTRMLKR